MQLRYLALRVKTGNAAIDHLTETLCALTPENAQLIVNVLGKNPECGVAEGSVNAVWDGLVFDFPVMKASAHDEKTMKNISYPAVSQLKLDGARCQIIVEKDKVTCLSSSGRPIETHGMFDYLSKFDYSVFNHSNVVFDGELLMKTPTGQFMERKKGNGYVNKALKNTITVDEAKSLHFVVFDIVGLDEWKAGRDETTYVARFGKLTAMADKVFRENVSIVETAFVSSEAEAVRHFKDKLKEGQEGTILKDYSGVWENARSKKQVKMKGIITCDLEVVGIQPGAGKYEGMVGSLIVRSSDGQVETNVGSGLSDADRKRTDWVGKIVEVCYNERIQQDGSDTWSLFLPRFMRVRIDKDIADTLVNIPMKM